MQHSLARMLDPVHCISSRFRSLGFSVVYSKQDERAYRGMVDHISIEHQAQAGVDKATESIHVALEHWHGRPFRRLMDRWRLEGIT